MCLIGGWAIYETVNKNFTADRGRPYIGSKDIDIGFHPIFPTTTNKKTTKGGRKTGHLVSTRGTVKPHLVNPDTMVFSLISLVLITAYPLLTKPTP
jgi:hypothetical protein